MDLINHKLYQMTLSSITPWLPAADRTQARMREKLKDKALSLTRRYEIGSFLYCETMVGIFARLEKIQQWTSRSVYPRKGEDAANRKIEWIIYSYHNYMVVYASIFEVTLQLVNEILDLGIPPRDCNFHSVLSNRRFEAAGIKPIMSKLANTTKRHREGKNLLYHYGKGTRPPVRLNRPLTLDDEIISKLGVDDKLMRQYLEEFLANNDQKELVKKMSKECRDIGRQVEHLFTSLTPHYDRIHNYYNSFPL